MTVALQQPQPPHVKRWTKAEYNEQVDRGTFDGQRLYLFRGELIEMSPMQNPHAMSVMKATKILFATYNPDKFDIRVQMPFEVPGESMPEPDLLVCATEDGTRKPHPSKAILIVEVSDSSLAHDREKALEYAAAGVPEYWIVDVNARLIEVYRGPVPDRSAPLGYRYPPPTTVADTESLVMPVIGAVSIKVNQLLP